MVVAPFNLTLGGGAEICLHATRRQPHAETYIGLVEAGVGLIPAGGGTKEMLLRAMDAAVALAPPDPRDPPSRFAQSAEMAAALKREFETDRDGEGFNVGSRSACIRAFCCLPTASLSTASGCCWTQRLRPKRWRRGWLHAAAAPNDSAPRTLRLAMMETGVFLMGEAGYASEHDQKVARWIAYMLAGGQA